ncbi:MAG: class I SAM-dependent methyltransferase [Acidimicrobiia bacterium]|nr:class I SAM-dependent methyltransferase [Acidimicrobiia bacterium]
MADLVPNHHAHYRQFGGLFGYLAGLTMIVGRGRDARLVSDLAAVGSDDVVLDIGCGPGTAARQAAGRGADVIGLDPSAPMLRLAGLISRFRPISGALEWRQASAETMDLPADSASVCWSIASVHHWQDLETGLDRLEDVLAPGARFLAVEKRTAPGATGIASHGWTPDQAELFASMLTDRGFADVGVSNHSVGRRDVVIVSGTWPGSGNNG